MTVLNDPARRPRCHCGQRHIALPAGRQRRFQLAGTCVANGQENDLERELALDAELAHVKAVAEANSLAENWGKVGARATGVWRATGF
ncbi:MAG TPA: hypothetical protein VFY45_19255 [Baekduia sp.]|nr:hypothetical protein [Baekduia sp.]